MDNYKINRLLEFKPTNTNCSDHLLLRNLGLTNVHNIFICTISYYPCHNFGQVFYADDLNEFD